LEKGSHLLGQGVVLDQVRDLEWILAHLADGHRRTLDRQRRDDHVDAGAVGEAGVDHRRAFVDPAADAGDDARNDLHQVRVAVEFDGRPHHLVAALDVDLVRAVDHDVGDCLVGKQDFQRAKRKDGRPQGGQAPERGQAAPRDGAPPDAAPAVGVPPAPGWHERSRLAARPAPSGLVAPEGRLAARWALASREGDWARAGLGGAGAAREEAARPWPEALEVWGPQARPGTFEYVRAATSGPYPQFNR